MSFVSWRLQSKGQSSLPEGTVGISGAGRCSPEAADELALLFPRGLTPKEHLQELRGALFVAGGKAHMESLMVPIRRGCLELQSERVINHQAVSRIPCVIIPMPQSCLHFHSAAAGSEFAERPFALTRSADWADQNNGDSYESLCTCRVAQLPSCEVPKFPRHHIHYLQSFWLQSIAFDLQDLGHVCVVPVL